MLTDEDITLNEDQLLDNLDDTNGDVDLMNEVNERLQKRSMYMQMKLKQCAVLPAKHTSDVILIYGPMIT